MCVMNPNNDTSCFLLVVEPATGRIRSKTGRYKQEIVGRIQSDGTVVDVDQNQLSASDFLEGSVYFTRPFIHCGDGRVQFVATPLATTEELFTTTLPERRLCFSNDLYLLADAVGSVRPNHEAISAIQLSGLPPAKQTIFEGIYRIIPGVVATVSSEGLAYQKEVSFRQSPLREEGEAYGLFTDSLIQTLEYETKGLDEIGLMFSGGVDSTLLGLVCDRILGKRVRPYVMKLSPASSSMNQDFNRSVRVADMLGWDLRRVIVDFDEHSVDVVEPYISRMPLAPHICLGFHLLLESMSCEGIQKAFSGQMLDALYMLGATSRIGFDQAALASLFRRFYLSDGYLALVGGFGRFPNARKSVANIMGYPGKRLAEWIKGVDHRLPRDANDLIKIFSNSPDDMVFQAVNDERFDTHESLNPKSSFEVFQILLRSKMSGYLKGGDTFAPLTAGKLHNVQVSLPYGSPLLARFFTRNNMSFRDVMFPKRYMYKFVNELEPRINLVWKRPKAVGGLSGQEWFNRILESSCFGRSLVDAVGKLERPAGITNGKYFSRHLYAFWMKHAISRARLKGI